MRQRGAVFARRAGAYLVDYVVIAAYALGLAAVTVTLGPDAELPRLAGYALALVTLTVPVIVVFSALEAAFGASPGKAVFGLRVRSPEGGPSGVLRSLARNIVKFLPWEVAHMGIWLTPGQPFIDPPGVLSLILMNAAMGAVLVQALLIGFAGAGVHDWIAALRVRAKS